jgi:hypothetical protein
MKTKFTILALWVCSLAILPAQTAAPEKPAPEKSAPEKPAEEPKAETPVEKQAFRIFDIIGTLPDIVGSIKDDASLTAASTKLDEMFEKLAVEETALKKLEVPDNEARKKLSTKLETKQKGMEKKMGPVMMALQTLPLETAQKLGPLMEKFSSKMDKLEPTMNKYFQTDEEKEDE